MEKGVCKTEDFSILFTVARMSVDRQGPKFDGRKSVRLILSLSD